MELKVSSHFINITYPLNVSNIWLLINSYLLLRIYPSKQVLTINNSTVNI